jgi:3-dehydroquinate synthase
VSDTNVAKHTSFLERFEKKEIFILDPKTDHKNWEGAEKILGACFAKNLDRSGVIIAIGGGVVGDMTGFVASIFMRGLPVIQVPTTLMGMVDSAIGGKTAINCKFGKNLIGSFHQPESILCCNDFLKTLPESEIKNGLAEMIKHGIIGSPAHFEDLEKIAKPNPNIEEIIPLIPDSIKIKIDIIQEDTQEKGARLALNLGHTFGHAIELLSDMNISHGQAVAIGTMMASNYSLEQEMCSIDLVDRIENIFNKFGIEVTCDFEESEIWEAMKHDKKKKDGHIRLVLPTSIGSVEVVTV